MIHTFKKLALCTGQLNPAFTQKVWHDPYIRPLTNCYGYALNCPEMGWGEPGRLILPLDDQETLLTSQKHQALVEKYPIDYTVKRFRDLLDRDGLICLTEKEALSGRFYAVAARISRIHNNFHFLRREENGLWFHKDGGRRPSYIPVKNPRKSCDEDVEYYERFVGYYTLPDMGISYVQRLDVAARLGLPAARL